MIKRQFDKKNIVGIYPEGSESNVYVYKEDNNEVALKVFKHEFVTPSKTEKIPEEVFKNKERKLILLNQSPYLDEDSKPIDLYYIGNEFIGYSMVNDKNEKLENYYSSSDKVKTLLLNRIREKINYCNEHGIYIGDFNTDNFRVREDGSIKLIDIDNFSIGGLDFDRPTNLVRNYKEKCTNLKNIDVYSFNYFSLGFISSREPYALERYLKEHGLPRKYNTEENQKLLEDLENINDDFEPRYFIDSKKKGLFF